MAFALKFDPRLFFLHPIFSLIVIYIVDCRAGVVPDFWTALFPGSSSFILWSIAAEVHLGN
jgi:hypothetical protein